MMPFHRTQDKCTGSDSSSFISADTNMGWILGILLFHEHAAMRWMHFGGKDCVPIYFIPHVEL